MTTTKPKTTKRLLTALVAGFALFAVTETAQAQEVLLTGPLAGAPAVRKLRLYRQSRFEFAPAVTFTLLDEYQRTIFLGARLTYNFTDWLGIGAWGAYGGVLQLPTALSDHIQEVNATRRQLPPENLSRRLTAVNLGEDFTDQLGSMDWVVAPQVTVVPFRGKLALFQSIYLDTDLYFFGGPAFVGLTERGDCGTSADDGCSTTYTRASRMAIAPTFGLGFSFYMSKWSALGFEYRGLPMAWNTGGFDTAGGGPDQEFPDNRVTSADQRFHYNQMLTVSFNIYLPTQYKVSE
jgi:outer membrane beta-barrel protein